MEKSYELAAKYMGQNGQAGQNGTIVQVPVTGQNTGQGRESPPLRYRRHGSKRCRGCNSR